MPLRFQGLCLDKGKYIPAIKGSKLDEFQTSDPSGIVKVNEQTFPKYFRHLLVNRRGTSIRCMCLGLLWMDKAICSKATSAAAGGGIQIQVECLWPFVYQSFGLNIVGLSVPVNHD